MSDGRRILLLGGTGEATLLAHRLADELGLRATLSLAGRTRRPASVPGPVRVGGFGGIDGLVAFVRREGIELVVDATHPFAARISANAAAACARAGIPRLLLVRPAWRRQAGDRWIAASNLARAAAALRELRARRVFLSVGRQELAAFADLSRVWFLVRLIEAPQAALPLPRHEIVVGRGPFERADERRLLARRRIDAVVSKNSGGEATYAKIAAARALGLPVVMVARPPLPAGERVPTVDAALEWIAARLEAGAAPAVLPGAGA